MSSLVASLASAHAAFPTDSLMALDPDDVKPGWVAFVIVVLMGVALYFILRSFVKQLRKVDFDEDAPRPGMRQPTTKRDDQPGR